MHILVIRTILKNNIITGRILLFEGVQGFQQTQEVFLLSNPFRFFLRRVFASNN
jgi:hypothetical protein